MNLIFREKYLSIESFNPINLAEFTVLTGINGSGKSQLLQAIEQKKVIIDGLENANIVYFNYETFKMENEGAFNAQQISLERESAWNFFEQQIKASIFAWKNSLGASYAQINNICIDKDKALWFLTMADVSDDALYAQLAEYKKQIKTYFDNSFKGNQQAQAIFALIKNVGYSIDEIKKIEFLELYKPYYFKSDFLPQQLGGIFWDYYIKFYQNQSNELQNEKHGKDYPIISEDEFIKKNGDKPWVVINKILEKFDNLDYKVNSPEGTDPFHNFQLKLAHIKKEGLEIGFEHLSSGERVLMALVASIYKSSADNHFPDLLLLDEIDASLHPSMISNLLEVINDIFLAKEMRVLLVTHSPTTVAFAPEESIFVMNKDGENRIEKKAKEDALKILTEGFVTLDQGIKLFDQISKIKISVVSEGKNTVLLKKAFELCGFSDVEVIDGVEDRSGSSQIKTLFDFFSKVPHERKVFFVWDCDVNSCRSLLESNNTIPFVFVKNDSNTIAEKGIENMFAENLFDDFKTVIIKSTGEQTINFDQNRKRDFEEFIIKRNNKEDFVNFKPLLDRVRTILG
jgi:ABC-type iron transport system FetAB ATPase subunit